MNIRSISAQDAYALLQNEDSIALDVRTSSEYITVHIPRAQHTPLDQLDGSIENIDRNKKIVVYCASGNRSRIACDILKKHQYDQCFNLEGGINMWRIHGLPVVNDHA